MRFSTIKFASGFVFTLLKPTSAVALVLSAICACAQDPGNGIHVGDAKVYDGRELTLMLDSLNKSLQGMNFINQGSLAAALGNVQGYQNTDTSTAFFANGAVGPQAASVFANNLPAGSSATTTTAPIVATPQSPTFNININPTPTGATTTSPTTTPAASTSPTGFGPSSPTLPTLQTAPTYNPTFGPSSGDMLTDETNLTYQIFNLSMLLSRSLTDRIYDHKSRLQAVVGFDIDIEPDSQAKDAVAVVEITAAMGGCPPPPSPISPKPTCDLTKKPEVVAMMPEQGSHNAATLTQKANSFGGALAAQVFSVGLAGQKRSQTFYLYRDIDTLSLQEPEPDSSSPLLHFGWQFRPVLGRHTVDAGLRHMLAVLSLPAADVEAGSAQLRIQIKTHWVRYEGKTQSISTGFCLFSCVPDRTVAYMQPLLSVPRTLEYQSDLRPHIEEVKWFSTDNANGVAIVSGRNFFPGTTVRIGNRTYTGNNDGLTLKSDQELELAVPLTAAVTGGVLSGRYGVAQPLTSRNPHQYAGQIVVRSVRAYPEGPDDVELITKLVIYPPTTSPGDRISCKSKKIDGQEKLIPVDAKGNEIPVNANGVPGNLAELPQIHRAEFDEHINAVQLVLNGTPFTGPLLLNWGDNTTCNGGFPPGVKYLDVGAIVPAKTVKGSITVSVVFPFEGPDWTQSGIYYDPALSITRVGSQDIAKLLISSNDPGDLLCQGWAVQLDRCEIPVTSDCAAHPVCQALPAPPVQKSKKAGKKPPAAPEPPTINPVLRCIDAVGLGRLSLDISASQIKNYKQLLLVHRSGSPSAACSAKPIDASATNIDKTRLGAIPEAKPKPPAAVITKGPQPASIQQYSSQTIKLEGTNLDQIKTVLFDKTQLKIVNQDASSLIVDIPRSMTEKPASHDQIQLISDQNDPVLFSLDITANPAAQKKEK